MSGHPRVRARWPSSADYNDLCSDGTARFCAEDPDGSGPVTGAMVLREDVRQLCILELTQTDALTSEHVSHWWNYVSKFNAKCPIDGPDEAHRFGDKCATDVMSGISGISASDVERCMSKSMDEKLEHQRINHAWSSQQSGSMDGG